MDKYIPNDTFYNMTIKNFTCSIIGILLGLNINKLSKIIFKKFNNTLQILFHIILCSILLSFIHININYFGWLWQNETPGLYFISFFFGVQFNLFNNINNYNA